MPDAPPPLLIALPHGLNVSGVTMWAVRLANALAAGTHQVGGQGISDQTSAKSEERTQRKEVQAQARAPDVYKFTHKPALNSEIGVGLVVHREPSGHDRLPLALHPDVVVFDAGELPPIEDARGNLEPYAAVYRDAVREMARRFGSPVILSPNLHGDYYGVAAQLSQTEPIRVVAWQHSDIEYNVRLFQHYEHVITRFVAVSDHIGQTLRLRLSSRAGDVVQIPYGVDVPSEPPARPARSVSHPAVRLIYTGRMEQKEKRVRVLVLLSDELHARGVAHRLTMLGDGPAADEIDAMIATRGGRIRRLPPVAPDRVASLLDEHDIFVLSSRYEGLSVSMLEAMARGCVPVVTRVDSGAAQVIEEGVNGIITQAGSNEGERIVVESLADAVERAIAGGLEKMSRRAWRTVSQRFSIGLHAALVREMLRSVAESPMRRWPSDKPCAFTRERAEVGVASGSVPADGARRMSEVLEALAGRKVVIYGAGEHTRQLAHIIEASPIRLLAIADDDPGRHSSRMLGVPIIAPGEIARTGASDVVISSWMHERAMHDRVAGDCHGTVLHRLYAPAAAGDIRGFADSASAS